MSYHDVLELTGFESMDMIVRRFTLLWAGSVTHSDIERLYRRAMCRELEGDAKARRRLGVGSTQGRKIQWTTCVNDGLSVFGVVGDRKEAAKRAVRWCETGKDGAETFNT